MKIIQVKLYNADGEQLTTWLDIRPELKIGAIVYLKDFMPDKKWRVAQVYPGEHETKDFEFHRRWDNNNYDKHNGLSL